MRIPEPKLFLWLACVLGVLGVLAPVSRFIAVHAQVQNPAPQAGPPPAANQGQGRVGVGPEEDNDNPIIRHAAVQAQMKRNEQRQKQIVQDTQKLSELAQQLKDAVASSNKNTPSITAAKKAEEIEKLAKSVKDKMKAE